MKSRVFALSIVLILALSGVLHAAEGAAKPADAVKPPDAAKSTSFAQAVITMAISFMPEDLKAKLTPVAKEIIAGAKPSQSSTKTSRETHYFVDKEDGDGPSVLAEQFRSARKKVSVNTTYLKLAPYLGKLAGTIIALSQPYHTGESEFKGAAHAKFEKTLDTDAATLKAEFDGSQKVTNPSEYAIQIAKSSNELLSKLGTSEGESQAETKSSVLSLAANSVADCWWTLLAAEKPKADTADSTTEESPTTGDFIGNARSLKFHLPTCRYLPAEKNRIYFKTRDEAVSQGFVPCKVCKP